MKKTVIAVIIFIALLIGATYNARADDGFRLSLGHTVFNSGSTSAELSYEKNNWEGGFTLIGPGGTKNGSQDYVRIASLSHVVRPSWSFLGATNYYRIGASYIDNSVLVGQGFNFRLGVGLEWEHIQLEYVHYSSAGLHETNTGIDMIQLRYMIH